MLIWKKIALVYLMVWICLLATAVRVYSAEPVSFDVGSVIAATDITSPEFALRHPAEKIVAIHARVSLYVDPQWAAPLDDVVISLESPSAEFEVVDFSPRTTLDTSLAGPVNVNFEQQQHLSLQFDAAGTYKAITGATLNGNYLDQSSVAGQFQLLPPRELVLAAGTVNRGRGVYFKLRANSRTTLEGEKSFLVVARVPRFWRGDVMRVSGEAHGRAGSLFGVIDEGSRVGRKEFLVALYQDGDAQARQLAEQFVHGQQQLIQLAMNQQRQIERNTTPRMLRKIGISASTLDSDWLQEWMVGPTRVHVVEKLPAPVRDAAWSFVKVRAELHGLNGEFQVASSARATSR